MAALSSGAWRCPRTRASGIEIGLRMVDAIDAQIVPLERELRQLARRRTGCRALMGSTGMGELTSLVTLCELGDVGRLSASRKAVRMAGIDIGVHRSDRRVRVAKLARPGSPQLRWALYEAALSACRPTSPDHTDDLARKARGLSHTRASLTIARKLARREASSSSRTTARRCSCLRPAPPRPHLRVSYASNSEALGMLPALAVIEAALARPHKKTGITAAG
jgi:transposase